MTFNDSNALPYPTACSGALCVEANEGSQYYQRQKDSSGSVEFSNKQIVHNIKFQATDPFSSKNQDPASF